MGPQPRRLMRDAVHGEGVEPDFFFHDRKASRTPPCDSPVNGGLLAEIVAFPLVLARQIRRGGGVPCCAPIPAL
jgi:hypothetical protein